MKRKRHSTEQIIAKLRDAEVILATGGGGGGACGGNGGDGGNGAVPPATPANAGSGLPGFFHSVVAEPDGFALERC